MFHVVHRTLCGEQELKDDVQEEEEEEEEEEKVKED